MEPLRRGLLPCFMEPNMEWFPMRLFNWFRPIPREIAVFVTAKDMDDGHTISQYNCPIALALKREYPHGDWRVLDNSNVVCHRGVRRWHYVLRPETIVNHVALLRFTLGMSDAAPVPFMARLAMKE